MFFIVFFQFVVKFLEKNTDEKCSDAENDINIYFDVAHRKWVKEIDEESGNAIVFWPPKPYLTSVYAKKGKDPEDNWLICSVQIMRWYSEYS